MKTRTFATTLGILVLLLVLTWLPLACGGRPGDKAQGGPGAAAPATTLVDDGGACPADAPPAPLDLTLRDMHGRDVNLADYKGKVILLNFWATWCGPCRLEIPGFVEMYDRYKDRGLVVLGLSIDDPPEKLPPFVSEFKMNYPVLVGLGRDDVLDAYGPILGVPTTLIIGRNGKICSQHIGLASKTEFEQEIESLL